MKQLSQQEANRLVNKVETVWAIENHYWYPLYDCNRSDVIAFPSDYIDGIELKLAQIQQFLISKNRNQIFEMHEDRSIWLLETATFAPYKDGHTTEKFWFDQQLDWIIYTSHEGSISFGGSELIAVLKATWHDWELHVFPVS